MNAIKNFQVRVLVNEDWTRTELDSQLRFTANQHIRIFAGRDLKFLYDINTCSNKNSQN